MSRIAKAAAVTAAAGAVLAVGAGVAAADAGARGAAVRSPGVISGNLIQVPIHVPVNICGNTVNGAAALNPTFGNVCINASGHHGNRYEHDRRHHDHGHGGEHRGGRDGHDDGGHDDGHDDD